MEIKFEYRKKFKSLIEKNYIIEVHLLKRNENIRKVEIKNRN